MLQHSRENHQKTQHYSFSALQSKLKILSCSSIGNMTNRFYLLYYNYFYLPKLSLQITALIRLHLRPFNLKKTVVQKTFRKQQIAAKGVSGSFNEIFLLSASLAFSQNRSILLVSPIYTGEHPPLSIYPRPLLALQLASHKAMQYDMSHPADIRDWEKLGCYRYLSWAERNFCLRRKHYVIFYWKAHFVLLSLHAYKFMWTNENAYFGSSSSFPIRSGLQC